MKRTLWAVAVLFFAQGCNDRKQAVDAGVPDAGPRQVSEAEPNDQREQALRIETSTLVDAALSVDPAKPDEDWYALVAEGGAPKTFDLALTGIPGGDVKLELYDVDRNLVLAVNSGGEGAPERLPNLGVRGRFDLRVVSAKKGSGGAYTLTAMVSEPEAGLELEPNDRAVDANVLPLEQPIAAVISHPADEDWFRIDLKAPPEGTTPPGSEDAPPAGTDPAQGAAAPTEPPQGATAAATPPADSGTPEPGGLNVRVTPESQPPGTEPQPAEPGAETAEPAPGVTAPSGEALPPEPPPSIALKIDVAGVPGVRLEVSVLSAAEAPLFSIRGNEGEPLTLRNIGVRATDELVYVVVKSAWSGVGKDAKRGFNAEVRYSLSVAKEAEGANAELEPNDEAVKATPLPENGFRTGFLSPKSDVDYFFLRPSQPVIARLQLSGVERVDLVLSVITPAGEVDGKAVPEQVLVKANDGALKEPEYLNAVFCAQECLFKVEGGLRKVDNKWVKDFENAELPYRLTIATTPDTGTEEREPNGSVDRATAIAFGRPVRGTIHPKKDSDYYRLDLSGRPVRTPIRATVLGILKVDVGLYLHRVGDDGKLSLVQTSARAKGDQPETIRYSAEPGVYVLEVRDTTGRESNFQDAYQLSVDEGS